MTGFPIAIVSFSVLVSLFATGASLLITLVGLPIIVLTWLVARPFARLERRRIAWVSGRATPEPAYRQKTRGGLGALVDAALDPQSIRDVVHGIAVFAVSCVTWTVGIAWAAVAPITVAWLVAVTTPDRTAGECRTGWASTATPVAPGSTSEQPCSVSSRFRW